MRAGYSPVERRHATLRSDLQDNFEQQARSSWLHHPCRDFEHPTTNDLTLSFAGKRRQDLGLKRRCFQPASAASDVTYASMYRRYLWIVHTNCAQRQNSGRHSGLIWLVLSRPLLTYPTRYVLLFQFEQDESWLKFFTGPLLEHYRFCSIHSRRVPLHTSCACLTICLSFGKSYPPCEPAYFFFQSNARLLVLWRAW